MAESDRSSGATSPDFAKAIAELPSGLTWRSHGRDPSAGLDCIGFALWVYRQAGIDLSHLDMPYGERDVHNLRRTWLIARRMTKGGEFQEISVVRPWADGDVLILRRNHLTVFVGGRAWEVGTDGLTWEPESRARVMCSAAMRYRSLSERAPCASRRASSIPDGSLPS